jgi:hypothetical protein
LLILMLDKIEKDYFIPIQRPTLLLRPVLLVGIPVAFAIERFTFVTPKARFHEKVRPGPSFIKPPGRNSNLDLFKRPRLTPIRPLFFYGSSWIRSFRDGI